MAELDLAALKERSREAWDGADYGPLGEALMPAARELVDACAVSAGQEVLDVAAGTGNAAALAAAEGARAVASDFSPRQVERGRARTEAEGLDVEWAVADAEELPFDEASFDCVLSVFGAQFPPRVDRVAAELFRVIRPGGTVGMANWPKRGFQHELFEVLDRYAPNRPEGVPHPRDWGEEEAIRQRFEGLAGTIQIEPRVLVWEFDSPAGMAKLLQHGPRQLGQLPDDQAAELAREAGAVVERYNTASDGTVRVEAEYTLVVARKRG